MKTINLYVTDWAPNGTNDLLICDENHQIVSIVEGATFGIDVMKHRSPINDLVASDAQVFSIPALEEGEEVPAELTFVRQIDVPTLKRFLVVSPVDSDGAHLIAELKRNGINIDEAA